MSKLFPIDRLNGINDRNDALKIMQRSSSRVWEIINGNYRMTCQYCGGKGKRSHLCWTCRRPEESTCTECLGVGTTALYEQRYDPEGGWRNCIICGDGMVEGPLCDVCEYWWNELKQYASDETIAVVKDAIQKVLDDEQN